MSWTRAPTILLVEHLSHQSLVQYEQTRILSPLGMAHSRFLPSPDWYPTIAPTQFDEHGAMLRGIVHDPTALLDRRAVCLTAFPLKPETLLLMTTPQQPPGKDDLRELGWDIRTRYSSPRDDVFPVGSFGHTRFTGTPLWMDPDSGSFVLILTNRVHPSGGHSIVRLCHDVATEVACALLAH